MEYYYETVKYSDKYPAKILLQNKPQRRCNTGVHWHKCIEILYVVEGRLGIRIDHEKTILTSGQPILINSKEMHSTYQIEPEENVKYLVVLLSIDYLKKYHDNMENVVFNIEKSGNYNTEIVSALREIAKSFEDKNPMYELYTTEKLLTIYRVLMSECLQMKELHNTEQDDKNFQYARTAIEYIGVHYTEKITLGDVADYIGLSKSYFARYFKKVTKKTFLEYLNSLRLEHGLNDMIVDGKTVTQAAFDNGFSDVKAFISVCKKNFDCTPGYYAKKNGNI